MDIWQEGTRARISRRTTNRFRAFAARSPIPPSSFLSVPSYASSSSRQRQSNVYDLAHIRQSNSIEAARTAAFSPRPAGTTPNPIRQREISASPLAFRKNTIPSSTSLPMIYSASRLRKELGTPSPSTRRTAMSANASPMPSYLDSPDAGESGGRRRGSTLLEAESIALPPSSSATGPSSTSSSSPLAHQSPLPPFSSVISAPRHDMRKEDEEGRARKHDRQKNKSRDTFEEEILKEMREKLAAAGLRDHKNDRKDIAAGGSMQAIGDGNDGNKESRSRSRSRSRSIIQPLQK